MPVMRCKYKGKSCYRWGEHGYPYVYTTGNERSRKAAYAKAAKQGRAIKRAQGLRGATMKIETIRKLFAAGPAKLSVAQGGGSLDNLISSELSNNRVVIEKARAAKDLNALSSVVAQIIGKMRTQVESSYGRQLKAAQSEEDRKFTQRVIDTVANYPWADKGFDLFGLLLKLLGLAGEELVRRVASSVKKKVAPELSDKITAILQKKLGRLPNNDIVMQVSDEIDRDTIVDWTQLTDAELETLVYQVCGRQGIPLTGMPMVENQ